MTFPDGADEILEEAVSQNPDSCNDAAAYAEPRIRKLAGFKEWAASLVYQSVLKGVHQKRSEINKYQRAKASQTGKPKPADEQAKPRNTMPTETINKIHRECLLDSYFIGNRSIGSLKGNQLLSLEKKEAASAGTHNFNAELLRELRKAVPNDDTEVRAVFSEKKFKALFKRIRQRLDKQEAENRDTEDKDTAA